MKPTFNACTHKYTRAPISPTAYTALPAPALAWFAPNWRVEGRVVWDVVWDMDASSARAVLRFLLGGAGHPGPWLIAGVTAFGWRRAW